MFSTTILDADYLEFFGRMTLTSSHIRIVASDEVSRVTNITAVSPFQSKPLLRDASQFPLLTKPSSTVSNVSKDPKPLSLQHSYSDILVYGRNRPKILEVLPTEIRELVWEACMRREGVFNKSLLGRTNIRDSVKRKDSPERPRFLPKLCFISKTTYNEIVAVFMRNSKFMIASINDNVFFRNFIASVENGPKHVRELHLDFFDCFPDYDRDGKRFPVNSDLELAVSCTGLETLQMTFKHWRLHNEIGFFDIIEDDMPSQKKVHELVDKYRLHRLLDCGKLRTIRWDGCRGYGGPLQNLHDLAAWVEAEFAKKNHRIQTFVTWRV
ncbi:hypothetical protein FB567DRAFT_546265 [Paraphoma chrysanthemicola]|uniref:Uncharacterized protein n=1 Tax=Paraphoma chrysanthemicola TaxID=798071 RepID=A0A8K0W2S5_9PLEO|nr:hypothetical protein FB567DRAFT_546265 [Paraphoma chrysanthemicola]